jgi:hypothetical protein
MRTAFAKQGVEFFHQNSEELGKFLKSKAALLRGLQIESCVRPTSGDQSVQSLRWRSLSEVKQRRYLTCAASGVVRPHAMFAMRVTNLELTMGLNSQK